ncbi:unnamed protein product [Acidithrix sp. C25]|nr:unnamed protein product [Acidithrix sp. C25]
MFREFFTAAPRGPGKSELLLKPKYRELRDSGCLVVLDIGTLVDL